jgi:hypothetical protein
MVPEHPKKPNEPIIINDSSNEPLGNNATEVNE